MSCCYLTFRISTSSNASQSEIWPLLPPAWDRCLRSFPTLVLHILHQTLHGQELWGRNVKEFRKEKSQPLMGLYKNTPWRAAPEECDVLSRDFFQFVEWCSLPCKAVVWVVVRHDGGGADLTELVLWTLQTSPHCMQVVLPAVPHWKQRKNKDKTVKLLSLRVLFTLLTLTGPHTCIWLVEATPWLICDLKEQLHKEGSSCQCFS